MDEINVDFYALITGWYELNPSFKGRDLYFVGHSFAGTYIPSFAKYILDQGNTDINIAGLLIGNGWYHAS